MSSNGKARRMLSWFNAIEEKSACVFTMFDICEFYPSISEKLLTDALQWRQRVGEEEQGRPLRCHNGEL